MSSTDLLPTPPQDSPSETPVEERERLNSPHPIMSIPFREQVKRGWDWIVFVW